MTGSDMSWMFDQGPNVACIASASVLAGEPVLRVTHYDDDDSWAFLDGRPADPAQARVVAMSSVLTIHPDLHELASLPPGWTACRTAPGEPWSKQQDQWEPDE